MAANEAGSSALHGMLLHELRHRISNNFQIIAAMTFSLRRETRLPVIHSQLEHIAEGLFAFADVNRSLLPGASGSLRSNIQQIAASVMRGFGRADLSIRLSVQEVELSDEQRHGLLLIVAELVNNALKHSFPVGIAGGIRITVRHRQDEVWLECLDSVIEQSQQHPRRPSKMVCALAEALGGRAELLERPGFATRVSLPGRIARSPVGDERSASSPMIDPLATSTLSGAAPGGL